MKVYISEMSFDESHFNRGDYQWKAETLYKYAEKCKLEPFDLPLRGIDLTADAFRLDNLKDFIFQCKRVKECDYGIPIILDNHGQIADGYHRVCKAILGRNTSKQSD